MSLIIEKFLICDAGEEGCPGESFGVDSRGDGQSSRELRKEAREEGWAYKDGLDYCYKCNPKVKP